MMCKDDIFINSISILCTYSNNLPLYIGRIPPPRPLVRHARNIIQGKTCVSSIQRYLLLKGKSHAVDHGSVCSLASSKKFSRYVVSAACNSPTMSLRFLYLFNFLKIGTQPGIDPNMIHDLRYSETECHIGMDGNFVCLWCRHKCN
jgi:hypothetical protein